MATEIDVTPDPDEQERLDAVERVQAIRDLSDFCNSWPTIRPLLVEAGFGQPTADTPIQAAVSWLVVLADHVYRTDEL
jgi:predicted protein tyrosine phosphatase